MLVRQAKKRPDLLHQCSLKHALLRHPKCRQRLDAQADVHFSVSAETVSAARDSDSIRQMLLPPRSQFVLILGTCNPNAGTCPGADAFHPFQGTMPCPQPPLPLPTPPHCSSCH